MNERGPFSPPEELARWLCDECGIAHPAAATVFQDHINGGTIGCEECSHWEALYSLEAPPGHCPNCGASLAAGYEIQVLVAGRRVIMGCEDCVSEAPAYAACREEEAELYPGWQQNLWEYD